MEIRQAIAVFALTAALSGQASREPLIGTVLDPDGKPVAGAVVEFWRAGGRGTGFLDLAYKDAFEKVATATTSEEGRFAVQLFDGLPCRIVVDQPPHAQFIYENGLPGLDLPIRLQRPAVLEGRITGPDGRGAKAKLRAWNQHTLETVVRAETDAEGHYRLDRIPPGPTRLEVTSDAFPSPPWHDLDLAVGEPVRHDVVLDAGTVLRGRVVDAAGDPIEGAEVGEGWVFHRAVRSDAEGRFEMRGMGSEGYGELHCRAPGFVRKVLPAKKAGAQSDLTIPLDRGQTVSGRVIDSRGQPLASAYVQVFGSVHNGMDQYHNCLSTYTDAEGRYRIGGLRADLLPVLVLRKDGLATKVFALPPAEDGVREAGTLALPQARIVRGTAVDAEGKPLAHAAVSIWGLNRDAHDLDPGGELQRRGDDDHATGWGLLDMYVCQRTSRTDHLGRFAFGDVAAGDWRIAVYDESRNIIGRSGDLVVEAARDPAPVRVETDR